MADSSIRSVNKQLRRDRILREAHRMIASLGFDGLNLRALAKAADVTVPTIYNLIGSKDELLSALVEKAVLRIEESLAQFTSAPALDQVEAVVIQSTALFAEDENFFRAALISGEHLGLTGGQTETTGWIDQRSTQMAASACRAALREGLLRGQFDADLLGAQMYALYRTGMHDWVYGRSTIEEFRRVALLGFYVCLAADASTEFHKVVMSKIENLTIEAKIETELKEEAA